MSMRSRMLIHVTSLLIVCSIAASVISAPKVSAQDEFPQPTETPSGEAQTAVYRLRIFLPVVSNIAPVLSGNPVQPTQEAAPTQVTDVKQPVKPTATRRPGRPTATKTSVPPTATKTAVPSTPTQGPVQPTATSIPPTATRPAPTATVPAPTATRPAPTATNPAPSATPVQPTATRPAPTATVNPTTSPGGRVFYVSPSGSDSNPGSLAAPWRTIQKAANSLSAGDTVQIRAGTYSEQVNITRSGSAAAGYITFSNYPGETPVINGSAITVSHGAGLINMTSVSYIKIVGLRVINSTDIGIASRSSNNIVVLNNSTQTTHSSGIGIWYSDGIVVDGNQVVDARCVTQAAGGHDESISIAGTSNFEVKNNDISLQAGPAYLGNEGIDVKESSRNGKVHHNYVHDFLAEGGAIYVDAWKAGLNGTATLSNIEIYSNVVEDAGQIAVGSEQGGTAENIKIYNNVVINGPAIGIEITAVGLNGPRRNIEIYNNTVYKARANGGAGIYIISTNISNVVIRNNITNMDMYNGQIVAASSAALAQITADHNLVYGSKNCSQAYPNCVEISNVTNSTISMNTTANPLFVNASGLNLRLSAGSPAIDRGVSLSANGVTMDMDGVNRPQGAAYDLGAYEYR